MNIHGIQTEDAINIKIIQIQIFLFSISDKKKDLQKKIILDGWKENVCFCDSFAISSGSILVLNGG